MNTVNFGGLGDSFIVLLKLIDLLKERDKPINHLFVESNEIVPTLIQECFGKLVQNKYKAVFFEERQVGGIHFETLCDPNYINNIKQKKWKTKLVIPTPWHGVCRFHGKGMTLKNPFLIEEDGFTKWYDICIQVSAGAKSDRCWLFDPRKLAILLRNKGKKVALIGTDPHFKDENDKDNFVNKTDLHVATSIINSSKLYIGLAGFGNYYACANKIENVYLPESDEHVKNYIHPEWKKYLKQIKTGTLQEVLGVIT